MVKVRELRKAKGWTVDQLADRAGISFGTLKNVERGRGVHIDTARKIANALNVSLDELCPPREKAS